MATISTASSLNKNNSTQSSNGKTASECRSFAEYVDVKSIAISGIIAAVFGVAGRGENGVVNSAFSGGLETGAINRTAQVFANFAMGAIFLYYRA